MPHEAALPPAAGAAAAEKGSGGGAGRSAGRGTGWALTCDEAAATVRRWHAWRGGGRAAFESKVAADHLRAQAKFDGTQCCSGPGGSALRVRWVWALQKTRAQ